MEAAIKFITNLDDFDKGTLEEFQNHSPVRRERIRAQAILLRSAGFKIKEIVEVVKHDRETISSWIKNFNINGLAAIYDGPRAGRPTKLNELDQLTALSFVADTPVSLKAVIAQISDELGLQITVPTLKRILKKFGLSWKRIRKSLKSRRDEEEFQKAKEEIKNLLEQAQKKKINLFFFDESSFNSVPNVPYAWQDKKSTLEVPSFKGQSLNVLGFMAIDNTFSSIVFDKSINTNVVVECIDEFSKNIDRKTVLVVDNAPTHTSDDFVEKIPEWKKRGLIIKYLPSYSPELNKIEILWRFIKFYWLPFSSYHCFNNLKNNLFHILKNIGILFKINFSIEKLKR